MITIEDFSTTATLQTIRVWFDDDNWVCVDLEIRHDYEEVTSIDMEPFGIDLSPELMAEIKRAVTDHVEQYFEVPEWEDDPDRVYERRNDK